MKLTRRNEFIALGLALVALGLFVAHRASQPSCQGLLIGRWFEKAVLLGANTDRLISRPYKAFVEMDRDPVPFLANRVLDRPSAIEKCYAAFYQSIPRNVSQKIPKPHDTAYYLDRRRCALELIEFIGHDLRFKQESGQPAVNVAIAKAIPAIRTALMDTNWISIPAVNALGGIGPAASVLVPELINLARATNNPASLGAVFALGSMGSAASNSVPLLIELADMPGYPHRRYVAQSLGMMGEPARRAVPVLVSLLSERDHQVQEMALRALAVLDAHRKMRFPDSLRFGKEPTNGRSSWRHWRYGIASLEIRI